MVSKVLEKGLKAKFNVPKYWLRITLVLPCSVIQSLNQALLNLPSKWPRFYFGAMIILYSPKARQLTHIVCRRFLWLVLLVSSLGACQRAVYQLQPAEISISQVVMPEPAPESAVLTIAVPSAARPIEGHQQIWRHLPHPKRRPQTARVSASRVLARAAATTRLATSAPQQRQDPRPPDQPVRYRSRTIALVLALLTFPFGLHNFYLGYYSRGAITLTLTVIGTYLLLLGLLGSIFSGTGLVGLGLVGVAILAVCSVWQFSDLGRIITNDLKPKNGEYR